MAMPSSAFILLYASLARAPETAMTLAARMVASAAERRDFDGVLRWVHSQNELGAIFNEKAQPPSPSTKRSAAE